jgi:hypothetical protein
MYFQRLLQKCFNRHGQFAGLPLPKNAPADCIGQIELEIRHED